MKIKIYTITTENKNEDNETILNSVSNSFANRNPRQSLSDPC